MTVEYAHGATVTSGTTASGESFRGEIFAYDADAGVLAVRTPGDVSNSFDVRFVNVDGATNVVVDASTAREPDALPTVDEPRCERRMRVGRTRNTMPAPLAQCFRLEVIAELRARGAGLGWT